MQAVNIFLIGPMGAGKSSIGAALSTIFQYEFFDTDALIQTQLNLTIAQIFAQLGEEYFRRVEAELIAKLTTKSNIILATGGGCIMHAPTRNLLQKRGLVCYLEVDINNQLQRLCDISTRPLLQQQNLNATLIQLAAARNCLYAAIADIIINTNNIACVDLIVELAHKITLYRTQNTSLCT